jgi:hypothetical protein
MSNLFTDVITVTNKLTIPLGQNSTNPLTRTKVPSPGALSYDEPTQLFYYGDTAQWNEVLGPQGPVGVTGIVGPQGPPGQAGATGPSRPTNDFGNVTWTLSHAQGEITIPSASSFPWNINNVGGNVTYNGTSLVAGTAGTYLCCFGFALIKPSTAFNVPQSVSLITNNDSTTAVSQYTLQERQDPNVIIVFPRPIYFNAKGQTGSVVITVAAGTTINIINSLTASYTNDFENDIDGTYTINGGVGAIAAYLTIHRIA